MGVVNVTPDSFSDGGRYRRRRRPRSPTASTLAAAGAAMLDVGGESTRPGADAGRRRRGAAPHRSRSCASSRPRAPVPVSIDTTKAPVAAGALDAGATMVNDVSGGTADPDLLPRRRRRGRDVRRDAHARHAAHDARRGAATDDVVREVGDELRARVDAAIAAGVARRRDSRRSRASDSRRPPSTTSRCSPRCPSSRRASRCRCSSARRASRSSAACSATRRSTRARRRRSRPRCGASCTAPRSCASTTSRASAARGCSCSTRSSARRPQGMAA